MHTEILSDARPLILIVEDMASLAFAYSEQLRGKGFDCVTAETGQAALSLLSASDCKVAAILLDLQLPDGDGLSLLKNNPDLAERFPTVVATSDGSITRAIEAMRLGAFDFLVKPLSAPRLIDTMRSATAVQRLVAPPHAVPKGDGTYFGFVGQSPIMKDVYDQIDRIARSRATVFVTGESGTGKEVCAEAIHKAGPRASKPFVAINCGAIPHDLLESELFGHLKGSFTGAVSDRVGAAQTADGGTLFLDEICEMDLKLQVKLLRFLQTGTIQRVGSAKPETVDVRIVCATNRHPEAEVEAGRFRADLFYRLAVIPIYLPPLRERGADIITLAENFLVRFQHEEGKCFSPLSDHIQSQLCSYHWPGNVRELQNMIRRAVVLHPGPDLPQSAFPSLDQNAPLSAWTATEADVASTAVPFTSPLLGLTLDALERMAIAEALKANHGSLPAAARMLGVSPSTLYRKRERWALRPD